MLLLLSWDSNGTYCVLGVDSKRMLRAWGALTVPSRSPLRIRFPPAASALFLGYFLCFGYFICLMCYSTPEINHTHVFFHRRHCQPSNLNLGLEGDGEVGKGCGRQG